MRPLRTAPVGMVAGANRLVHGGMVVTLSIVLLGLTITARLNDTDSILLFSREVAGDTAVGIVVLDTRDPRAHRAAAYPGLGSDPGRRLMQNVSAP